MEGPFLTILVTDAAGASRLYGRREDDAPLREHLGGLRAAAGEHGGHVVRSTGAGLLVTFPSAVAAARCAVAMQRADGSGLGLRIGLDAGEPAIDGGEPRGTPVLTASGLCDSARPGEILVSEVVRAVAAPHLDEPLRPGGTVRLRDLPAPVAVSHLLWRGDDVPSAPERAQERQIRVVIADDQRLLRAGFRVILEAEPDIAVVGEAGDGRTAVDLVLRLRPDVVLMDIRMPELDGLDAAERLLSRPGLGTAVVVLTTFDASEYVYRALRIGASGFLLKDTPSDRLVDAVRVAADGDALIAPSITRRLVERFSAAAPHEPGEDPRLAELTPRELEVLRLIARGLSNPEIAAELVLTENTVKTHVAHVLSKLGLRDRVQAVVLAYETGLAGAGA